MTSPQGTVAGVLHDAAGSRLEDGARRYRYDLAGNLAAVEMLASGVEVVYAYDGDGDEVRLSSSASALELAESTRFTWDVTQPLPELVAEHDGQTLLRRYTHTPLGPLAVADAAGVVELHADGIGSITATTDSDGALATVHRYDTWGTRLDPTAGGHPVGVHRPVPRSPQRRTINRPEKGGSSLEAGHIATDLVLLALGAAMFYGFASLYRWIAKHQAKGGPVSHGMARASRMSAPMFMVFSVCFALAFFVRLVAGFLGIERVAQ